MPGPSATASARSASSSTRLPASSDRLRLAVSATGSVMNSIPRPATTGCWDTGVAIVQSPAPLAGEATNEVFRRLLGMSPEQIDALRAAEVIF